MGRGNKKKRKIAVSDCWERLNKCTCPFSQTERESQQGGILDNMDPGRTEGEL